MIEVAKLWERLNTLGKNGTSGYFTQAEFNSNLYSVQYTVHSLLCDNYEDNQKVSDALINHIVEVSPITSLANGYLFATSIVATYTDYYRTLAVKLLSSSVEYPSKKISVGEETMYSTSPIRKADLTINRTLYLFKGNKIQVHPKTAGQTYTLVYCKKPTLAKIAYTTATDANNDYLVIDAGNTTNIDYPEGLFNLFTYLMLESMGIEQKEQLSSAYAELGINRTIQTDIK